MRPLLPGSPGLADVVQHHKNRQTKKAQKETRSGFVGRKSMNYKFTLKRPALSRKTIRPCCTPGRNAGSPAQRLSASGSRDRAWLKVTVVLAAATGPQDSPGNSPSAGGRAGGEQVGEPVDPFPPATTLTGGPRPLAPGTPVPPPDRKLCPHPRLESLH